MQENGRRNYSVTEGCEKEMTRKLMLYDPRTNVSTETDYDFLSELTGVKRAGLSSYKTRKRKIRSINCYLIDEKTTLKDRQQMYAKEKFPDENWVAVEGSERSFLVSNYGRFKRVYKNVDPGFIMPFMRKQCGNLFVKVDFQGIYKAYKVSHLVAYHYIGKPSPGISVRRKNGIRTDNFAGNLEYVSKQALGRDTGALSKSKPVIQLCKKTMQPIEEYRSAREAGRRTFTSYQTVLDNCNGKTKVAAGTYKFMFLDDYEAEGMA